MIDSLAPARRVLSTRDARWARTMAHGLARAGVRPNAVSIAGVVFAAGACAAFAGVPDRSPLAAAVLLVVAAASIQLRLLCNLLDGMLAVEEGLKSATGEIYNELPDRLADVLVLAGAGYALPYVRVAPMLGWLAAVLAVLTAYVRVLGGSLGAEQPFVGPMAKQHRMFTLTVAALAGAVEAIWGLQIRSLSVGLLAIVVGSAVTVIRRIRLIAGEVNAR